MHLLCLEDKLLLLQRYKLIELTRSDKARKRVQYFSEFIKKFPECDADPRAVYEQIVEKIALYLNCLINKNKIKSNLGGKKLICFYYQI